MRVPVTFFEPICGYDNVRQSGNGRLLARQAKRVRLCGMESTESNGRSYFFKPGNQYGVGHGRPKGGKKLVRAALAGKLDAGRFAEIVGRDLAAAERGDFRA